MIDAPRFREPVQPPRHTLKSGAKSRYFAGTRARNTSAATAKRRFDELILSICLFLDYYMPEKDRGRRPPI